MSDKNLQLVYGFFGLVGLVTVICGIGGCSREQYKADADEEVYSIIDSKWNERFGSKANFRISDVEASASDVNTVDIDLSGKLSLADAVAIATVKNRSYQNSKESLYLSSLDLTMARHRFDTTLFGLVSGMYQRDPLDETIMADGRIGFDKLLADGAAITSSIAVDWFRFLTGDPSSSLGSVLQATVRQPLLRGSGRRVVQENLTQAERDALYEIRDFNRFRQNFVVDVVDAYYGVLQGVDRVKNEKNNFDNLTISQKRIEAMADTGRLPQFQASEAQQSTLSARDRYVSAQESFKSRLDEFKIRLGLPTDVDIELDQAELEALEIAGISDPNSYDLDEAIVTALEYRLDLANTRGRLDDAARKVELAADGLGMSLDLVGSMNVPSLENNYNNLQFRDGKYSLGLSANLPLDRKAERNSYRKSLITFNRRKRDLEEEIDYIKLSVRQAYRDLGEAYTSYQIRDMSLELAEKRVEMQQILLQEGRSTTRDYLFAQSDLLSAQNSKTDALVNYTIAKLSFFRDIGILQVRPDGMWDLGKETAAKSEDAGNKDEEKDRS